MTDLRFTIYDFHQRIAFQKYFTFMTKIHAIYMKNGTNNVWFIFKKLIKLAKHESKFIHLNMLLRKNLLTFS